MYIDSFLIIGRIYFLRMFSYSFFLLKIHPFSILVREVFSLIVLRVIYELFLWLVLVRRLYVLNFNGVRQ